MNVIDMAKKMAAERGHEVEAHRLSGVDGFRPRSRIYEYVCVKCRQSVYFYEGEWSGGVLTLDCRKEE